MSPSPRPVGLVILQAIGAVGLLAYPLAVMGSFFGALAQRTGDRLGWILPAVLVTYPLLWCGLWVASWKVRRRGRPRLAIALSALPALATIAAPAALWTGGVLDSVAEERRAREEDARLRAENPLVADLVAAGLLAPAVPARRLEESVAGADPALLSKPVTGYGTPLRIALRFSQLETTLDDGRTRPPFLDAARRLIARGARLTPEEERDDPCLAWLAATLRSGTPLPDPRARDDNPLVWAIATTGAGPSGDARLLTLLDEVERTDPGQLTREARTYGTPLAMALRRNQRVLVSMLLARNARLSALEVGDAALRARLALIVRAELDPARAEIYLAGIESGAR